MTVVGSSDECYCVYHLVAGLAGYSRPYLLYRSTPATRMIWTIALAVTLTLVYAVAF